MVSQPLQWKALEGKHQSVPLTPSASPASLQWYVIFLVVAGSLTTLAVTGLLLYRYFQKRRQVMTDPESRLSAAFREGFLREDAGPRRRSESDKKLTGPKTSETSFKEDANQQSRRLIGSQNVGSSDSGSRVSSCGIGSGGYGGTSKESNFTVFRSWIGNDEEIHRRHVDFERLHSPKEAKIVIETRGEKSYPITSREEVEHHEVEDKSQIRGNNQREGQGFIEKCYEEYKNKKHRLSEDKSVVDKNPEADKEDYDNYEDLDRDENFQCRLGKLIFEVRYDQEKLILSVSIFRAVGLPIVDRVLGSSDPYVKLQLLPDKKLKVKTRLLKKTQNPVFDEQFDFYNIESEQIKEVTLHFSIYSFDRFSRDHLIGEIFYPLADAAQAEEKGEDSGEVEVSPDETKKKSTEIIQDETERNFAVQLERDILPHMHMMGTQNRGELLLSLCYHPANYQLTVTILKARNLPKTEAPETIEPYVKIYLKFDGQTVVKRRTSAVAATQNPVYNETFIFQLPRTSSEIASMLAWNRFNPMISSASASFGQKSSLPCRFQNRAGSNDAGVSQEDSNKSLLRRFSICSSTLLEQAKMNSTNFTKSSLSNNGNSTGISSHIMDRFSLTILVIDEEEVSDGEYIGRIEIGSNVNQQIEPLTSSLSNDLNNNNNSFLAREHWKEIVVNSKKQIAKWYQLTD